MAKWYKLNISNLRSVQSSFLWHKCIFLAKFQKMFQVINFLELMKNMLLEHHQTCLCNMNYNHLKKRGGVICIKIKRVWCMCYHFDMLLFKKFICESCWMKKCTIMVKHKSSNPHFLISGRYCGIYMA